MVHIIVQTNNKRKRIDVLIRFKNSKILSIKLKAKLRTNRNDGCGQQKSTDEAESEK